MRKMVLISKGCICVCVHYVHLSLQPFAWGKLIDSVGVLVGTT